MPMQATTTTPLFSAVLKPDRSPRIVGGWVALAFAGLLATPFVVLVPDAALPIGVALISGIAGMSLLSARQSRRRRHGEQVTLWPDQLEVSISDGKGSNTLRRFNPNTVRLVLTRDDDEKTTAVHLRAGKETLEIAGLLSTDDKSSFAKALGTALRRARQPA